MLARALTINSPSTVVLGNNTPDQNISNKLFVPRRARLVRPPTALYFLIPLWPFSLPHFLTLESIPRRTNTIAKLIIQLRNVSRIAHPFLILPPKTLVMTKRVMNVVVISSSPFSKPAMPRFATSSAVCPASSSSSFLVMSALILFSASNDSVRMAAGKMVCTCTGVWEEA